MRSRNSIVVPIYVLLLSLATPLGTSGASPISATGSCIPQEIEGLGLACRRPDGNFDVVLRDGTKLLTHGGDPKTDHEGPSELKATPKAPRCATDYHQHVLYARPRSAPNRYSTVKSHIRSIFYRMNGVLNAESISSGGPKASYKVACDMKKQMRIDQFVVSSDSVNFDAIVNEARNRGFDESNADYTIFYDEEHLAYCGVGSFAIDDRPGVNNANNNGGDYGVTYKGCWNGRTPMHENGHNQGAVQRLAPMSDLNAHCLEGRDVMCYTSSFVPLCTDRMHFDCGNDTYFDAKPEPGEWLATHWNIGSRVNRFIAFGV